MQMACASDSFQSHLQAHIKLAIECRSSSEQTRSAASFGPAHRFGFKLDG
jgi:hypothetical protein